MDRMVKFLSGASQLKTVRTYSTKVLEKFSWKDKVPICQVTSLLSCMELSCKIHHNEAVQFSVSEIILRGTQFGNCYKHVGDYWAFRGFLGPLDVAANIQRFGINGQCCETGEVIRYSIDDVWYFEGKDENDGYNVDTLLKAIQIQPVVVSIDVNAEFDNYSGGYYKDKIGIFNEEGEIETLAQVRVAEENGPLHAVVAIGWKYIKGELFIQIQNSWDRHWGEGGLGFVHIDDLARDSLVIPIMRGEHYPLAGIGGLRKYILPSGNWALHDKKLEYSLLMHELKTSKNALHVQKLDYSLLWSELKNSLKPSP